MKPSKNLLLMSITGVLSLTGCGGSSSEEPVEPPPVANPPPDPEVTVTYPQGPLAAIFDGVLEGADYWSEEPKILSAGVGFTDIIGLQTDNLDEDIVRQAGGAWSTAFNCEDDQRNITSAVTQEQVSNAYIMQRPYGDLLDDAIGIDGLPVVFSWPVDTSTIDLTDFQITLNTGEVVSPLAASPAPNVENNERNVVVLFGEFANRLTSDSSEARFPVKVEIIEDDNPLLLVGPDQQVIEAVGLSWETDSSPYDDNNGPRLVGAKLNHVGDEAIGESFNLPAVISNAFPPNDEFVLYDEGDFRIRILTTGGFSPDGVRGVLPTDFETFFKIHVSDENGSTVIMDISDVDYSVPGGSLRVVGLSDLGQRAGTDVSYDGCYDEDYDNYIDIILVGDEAAARNITYIEIPSLAGNYAAFYNPGGPGSTPFAEVTYTSPGPADLEPVIIALDDPMRVNYNP